VHLVGFWFWWNYFFLNILAIASVTCFSACATMSPYLPFAPHLVQVMTVSLVRSASLLNLEFPQEQTSGIDWV
jgi:hypothetical protein